MFEARGQASLPGPVQFKIDHPEDGLILITLRNLEEVLSGAGFHVGLLMGIELDAASLKAAMDNDSGAVFWSNFVVHALRLSNGVFIERAQIVFAFEVAESESEPREFFQILPFLSGRVNPKEIELDALKAKQFVDKLGEGSQRLYNRMHRAMAWQHQAVSTPQEIEGFLKHWIALETLNPYLAKKLNVAKEEKRECPKCGEEIGSGASLGGLVEHFRRNGQTDQLRKIRQTRNALFHGYKDFGKVINRIREVMPALEESVVTALETLSGGALKHGPEASRKSYPPEILLMGKIFDVSNDDLKNDRGPFELSEYQLERKQTNKISLSLRLNWRHREARMKDGNIALRGDWPDNIEVGQMLVNGDTAI